MEAREACLAPGLPSPGHLSPLCGPQLRVNQEELSENSSTTQGEGQEEDAGSNRHKHCESKRQMRTNVVQEIMDTERVYIKHLKDICEVRRQAVASLRLSPACALCVWLSSVPSQTLLVPCFPRALTSSPPPAHCPCADCSLVTHSAA